MKTRLSLEEVVPHQWRFIHPPEAEEYEEEFWKAIDLLFTNHYKKAESMLEEIIRKCPDFIDACHHLALGYEAQQHHDKALALWEEAVNRGKRAFPPKFRNDKDLLEWGWIENRPFLRACEGLAMAYYDRDKIDKAVELFDNLLSLNPNDNQGVRAVIIDAYFYSGQPAKVLDVCKNYADDMLPDTIYGKVLANLKLGKKEPAKTALAHAYKRLPLVAEELAKSRHIQPKNKKEGYVTIGGKDQAFEYWESTKRFWQQTPGAIDFIKDFLNGARN